MPALIFIVAICLLVWMYNEFKESWRNGFGWLLWMTGTLCIIGGFFTGFGFLILWPIGAVLMSGAVKLHDYHKPAIKPADQEKLNKVYEQTHKSWSK